MHSFEEDKELDFVAKRAAEAFDAPGMANWDKMQSLLDKEMPLEKPNKRFAWVIIPVILLLGAGAIWWNLSDKETIKMNPITKENISPSTKNSSSSSIPSTNQVITPAETPSNKHQQINENSWASNKSSFSTKETPSILTQLGEKTGSVSTNQAITDTHQPSETVAEASQQQSIISQTTALADNTSAINTVQPIEATEKSNQPVNQNSSNNNNVIQLKKNLNGNKGFFVGLTAGIDASTVHFNYKNDIGYNVGGLIGYQFNKHFSLQTGGIYTQKNYKMNGVDFHAPKGTWVSYFKMETVTGSCAMWDIPLVGTYHFQYNGKGHYFLSLGTSSYFMKKENYDYLYYVNNQTYNRSASYQSTDQHLFALAHFSAGIEKSMGKNLVGIIEPYAKIPMGGVGFGSIELSSFGVNFSLLYKQPKKK